MRTFFQRCADIEEALAEIYRELASSPLGDADLRQIWREMAREEGDHARQLRLAARLPEEETVRAARIPLQQVLHLRDLAVAYLQEVKGGTLTLEGALQLSMRLENEFAGIHAHCAAEFIDEQMSAMFRALAWDDERHAQTLFDYCRAAGIGTGENA